MKAYEGMVIFPPEAAPETIKKQEKSVEDIVQKFQGTVVEKTDWGRRPLGYPVKKFREGRFMLFQFQLDPSKVSELRNAFQLQEEIIKFMLTVKDIRAAKPAPEKAKAAISKPAAQVGSPSS